MATKPVVFIFTTAYAPFVGGAELAVQEITRRLKDNFEFIIITARLKRSLAKQEQVPEGAIYRVGFGLGVWDKLLLPFLGARRAWFMMRGKKEVILWSIMISYASIAAFLLKLFYPKIPFMLTLQEGNREWDRGLSKWWWTILLRFTKIDRVTAISDFLKDRAREAGYKGPISVVPNGVDEKFFQSRYTRIKFASQNTQIHAEKDQFLYADITYQIRGACFEVWKHFRGAFKEVVVERALKEELEKRGLVVEDQKQIPIMYEGKKVGAYIPDLIVNGKVIVELKRKPTLTKEDEKQFWLYLKGTDYKLGLLINFGSRGLEIKRRIYDNARDAASALISVSPKAYNRRKSAYIIFSSSRLVYKNGIDILLEAAARLKDEFDFQIILAGDGPEQKKLKLLTHHLSLITRVQFLGNVPYEQMPELYKQADIFARPSRSEGLGSAFLEAMAAGCITIGTPVGGIPDFLIDGKTGFLARHDDADDLARVLRKAFAMSDDKRNAMIESARALVRERFLWRQIAEEMKSIFVSHL